MSLANPAALWLLAAVPLVLLLHMYRVQRREVRVTTLSLWEAVDDRRGSPRPAWLRLRPSVSLGLQLLAVVAAALAIANPLWSTTQSGWPRVVMIVDTSASMHATDVPEGRFEAARRLARDVAEGLDRSQSGMLMTSRGEIVIPFTTDTDRLRDGIDALAATHRPDRLSNAVDVARRLVAAGPAARIHVFTDAAEPSTQSNPDTPLVWHLVGAAAANAGITEFALRRDPAPEVDYQLYLTIANFDDAARAVEFEVAFEDALLHQQVLSLPPGVQRGVVLPFRHDSAGVLTARIAGGDALGADDAVHAVLPAPRSRRIALVGEGDLFLEEALRADGAGQLFRAPSVGAAHAAGADVVVIDTAAPERLPPGRYLLLGALPADAPIASTGRVERPAVTSWHQTHPVMRDVDLTDLLVEEALAVQRKEPESRGTVLAEASDTLLMYAWDDAAADNAADRDTGPRESDADTRESAAPGSGADGSVRAVFLGFRSLQSDLRVRVAFPLLVGNALEWLHPVRLDSLPVHYRTGAPVPGERPDIGLLTGIHARHDAAGGGSGQIAINLLDATESDIAPGRAGSASGPSTADVAPPTYPHQQALWLILALIALAAGGAELALYLYRRRRQASPLATGLRLVTLALAAAALWQPRMLLDTQARHVVFVVDESASVGARAADAAFHTTELAAGHADPDDTVGIVGFSGDARVIEPGDNVAGPVSPLSDPEPDAASAPGPAHGATDLALALRRAQTLLPETGDRRVVLLSDGHDTVSDPARIVQNAHGSGIAIHPVVIGGPAPGEISVERVDVPADVRRGEPFDIRVTVRANQDGMARIGLFRDGTLVRSGQVQLRRGDNPLVHREVMDREGFGVFEARIESAEDGEAGNNHAAGVVAVRPALRALLFDPVPAEAEYLARALSTQNIDVSVHAEPAAFAAASAAAGRVGPEMFADFDVVLLSNLSSLALTDAHMRALRDFVRDRGGGLVMLGGERSFGLGGYYDTPVEEALPVRMVARRKLDAPSTAIVLLIDRSGSMNQADDDYHRLALAREAAQRAVSVMDQRTELGVLAFDMKSTWVVPIGPIGAPRRTLDAIASMRAGGGGTQLMWGLQKAYRAIDRSPAVIRHVIILSDGEVYSSKFPELLGRMVRKKITVSAVTIGSETGKPQLQSISEMGQGRFYFTSDASKLPRIFTMETQLATRSGLVEESFRPVARALHHEVARGNVLDAVPVLDGYVATTARRGADVLLEGPAQDPVLAVWRFGLGRTAVFTSEIKPRWGAQWVEWESLGPLFAQLVRWAARSERRDDLAVRTHVDTDQVDITVDVAGKDGRLVNFADVQAEVIRPDRESRVLQLRQVAPGRHQGTVAAAGHGAYLVAVSMNHQAGVGSGPDDDRTRDPGLRDPDAGADVLSTITGAVVSYPDEYRHRPPDRTFLNILAARTGGQVLAQAADVFQLPREPYPHPVPVREWLLAAALAMLLLDLGARWRANRMRERT